MRNGRMLNSEQFPGTLTPDLIPVIPAFPSNQKAYLEVGQMSEDVVQISLLQKWSTNHMDILTFFGGAQLERITINVQSSEQTLLDFIVSECSIIQHAGI